jgi:divalent metal cation (Fe/Co/Zn/Cd) transporter
MDKFKRALGLEYFTVGYNVLEAVASIVAGGFANSIALVGFGLDSVVESLSGLILIWRLRVHGSIPAGEEERIEKRATRFVGGSFLALAAYVLFESVKKIITGETSDPSLPGIIIAVLSLVIMPVLGYKKFRLGKELGLASLVADSKETFVCATLSVALFAGLTARYFLDFPLADPIVGLVIVAYLVKEGIELVRGECGAERSFHGE